MTEITKRGKGRPRSTPTEGKRYSISTNVSANTRMRLEQSADRNGQSIAKEADDRLRQSLLDEEQMGGSATARALRMLAGVIWTIEQAYGKNWDEDDVTAMAVEAAVAHSFGTIIRTVALDYIGQLAVMDLLEPARQKASPEELRQADERKKLYDEASKYGLKVAMGAARNPSGTGGQA